MNWRITVAIVSFWICLCVLHANAQETVFIPAQQVTKEKLIEMWTTKEPQPIEQRKSCQRLRVVEEKEPRPINDQIPAIPMPYNRSTPDPHVLGEIAGALNSPTVDGYCVRVEGHTDPRGSATYNQRLSERRAHSVVAHLEQLGVKADRLEAVGYGKQNLFCQENTEDCWEKDRAVRFVLLGE